MSENVQHTPPQQTPFEMNYAPGIPGVQLLGEERLHLLSGNLTMHRNAKDGEPAYLEDGWRINSISEVSESGQLVAHMQRVGGKEDEGLPTASLSKQEVSLTAVEALNPPKTAEVVDEAVINGVGRVVLGDQAEIVPVSGSSEVGSVSKPEKPEDQWLLPDLTDVFASPGRFEQVVGDPRTEPQFKVQLKLLQQSWMEVQLSSSGDIVWDELIKERLQSVSEVLPSVVMTSGNVGVIVEEMQQGLLSLRDAIEYRDTPRMQEIIGQYGFANKLDHLLTGLRAMEGDGQLGEVRRRLDANTIEADERVQKIRRGVYGDISDNDLEVMVSELGELAAQGMDVPAMRSELADRIKTNSPGWRGRHESLEVIGQFARMTDNELEVKSKRLENDYQAFVQSIRGGRYDAAHVDQIARVLLEDIKQQVEQVRRLAHITNATIQETH